MKYESREFQCYECGLLKKHGVNFDDTNYPNGVCIQCIELALADAKKQAAQQERDARIAEKKERVRGERLR